MNQVINFMKRLFGKSPEQPPKIQRFAVSIIQAGYLEDGKLKIINNLYSVTACSEQEAASAAVSECLSNEENRWMKIYKPNSMPIP